MYVSYDFYKQTFGDTIPEADFSKVEAKAEVVIGYLTYINGDIFAKEDNRVKLAVCAAAEVVHYHNNQASANGNQAAGVKSETNDGYSVTYITEGQDGQTAEELLRKKIPFATNAATAEVLVQGLRRGDLDWRNIVNPQKR